MPLALAALVTAFVYLLHQDVWFWRSARPLVFGFLPIGLFYHAAYTAGISLFMWFMVHHYWPSHLDDAPGPPPARARTRMEADGAAPPGQT